MILSARMSEADQVYGIENGADDFITKPFFIRSDTCKKLMDKFVVYMANMQEMYRGKIIKNREYSFKPGHCTIMHT